MNIQTTQHQSCEPDFASPEHGNSLPFRSFVPKLQIADPESVARSLLECVGIGTESIIQAGEIAHYALKAYLPGSSERTRFFACLVEAGFISKSEARAEGQSPKISQLSSIGQHSSVLRMPDINTRLSPGYSTFYAAVQLYKEFEAAPDAISNMVDLLKKAEGDASREFLSQQTKELKRAKASQAAQKRSPAGPVEVIDANDTQKAELVFLTPTVSDNKRFLDQYADPDVLGTSYRVNELVADTAVAVCVTDLKNYPVVADVILPYSGFK